MNDPSPSNRDRRFEIEPIIQLEPVVFDACEGQPRPERVGTGGYETCLVLLPTFDCDCSQPEPRAKPKDTDQPPEQDKKFA